MKKKHLKENKAFPDKISVAFYIILTCHVLEPSQLTGLVGVRPVARHARPACELVDKDLVSCTLHTQPAALLLLSSRLEVLQHNSHQQSCELYYHTRGNPLLAPSPSDSIAHEPHLVVEEGRPTVEVDLINVVQIKPLSGLR